MCSLERVASEVMGGLSAQLGTASQTMLCPRTVRAYSATIVATLTSCDFVAPGGYSEQQVDRVGVVRWWRRV